jgi:hypothetical protein
MIYPNSIANYQPLLTHQKWWFFYQFPNLMASKTGGPQRYGPTPPTLETPAVRQLFRTGELIWMLLIINEHVSSIFVKLMNSHQLSMTKIINIIDSHWFYKSSGWLYWLSIIIYHIDSYHWYYQWIGLRENWNRNPPMFHGKIHGFRLRFSLQPIHWSIKIH